MERVKGRKIGSFSSSLAKLDLLKVYFQSGAA